MFIRAVTVHRTQRRFPHQDVDILEREKKNACIVGKHARFCFYLRELARVVLFPTGVNVAPLSATLT